MLNKLTYELHVLRDCENSLFSCSKCEEVFSFNNMDENEQRKALNHNCLKAIADKILSKNEII